MAGVPFPSRAYAAQEIAASRVDGRISFPAPGPLNLTLHSDSRIRWAGPIYLPDTATTNSGTTFQQAPNLPTAYTVEVWFTAPGQIVYYFGGTLAYTSKKANEVIRCILLDPNAPPNDGTWKFELVTDQNDIISIFTWKNAVDTCGTLPPGSPAIGDRWLDLTTGYIRVWNGAAWLAESTPVAGDAVMCKQGPTFYVYDGSQWIIYNFESTIPGLGLKYGALPFEIQTENGRGLIYTGNKNEPSLGAGLGFDGPGDGATFSVQVDGDSIEIVGNELKQKAYKQTFNATSDWTLVLTDWTLVVTGATHGMGNGCSVVVFDSLGNYTYPSIAIDNVSGDITLTVPSVPLDYRFAGRLHVNS